MGLPKNLRIASKEQIVVGYLGLSAHYPYKKTFSHEQVRTKVLQVMLKSLFKWKWYPGKMNDILGIKT